MRGIEGEEDDRDGGKSNHTTLLSIFEHESSRIKQKGFSNLAISHLLSREDKPLLRRWNTLFLLYALLDPLDLAQLKVRKLGQ